MVSPPGLFLKAIRVSGSFLFVAGAAIFLMCAGQVYYNKFFRKGVALKGLYSFIRHPQYLGLGLTGLGLSILWPRFLVVALWAVMLVLYYILARDEERRMVGQFDAQYREYMAKTGMFLPKALEKAFPYNKGAVPGIILLGMLTLGGAFALRTYTVKHLPLWTNGQVTALAILPDDLEKLGHRMADVLDMPEIKSRLQDGRGPYLAYFMPKDYVMQGMIADTGGEWKLYKRHHTIAMITDWIFHPFRHLEGGCATMQHDTGHSHVEGCSMHQETGHGMAMPEDGVVRRMIFLRIETGQGTGLSDLFGINARRVPLFVTDVDIHNLTMKEIKDLPSETGWGTVPTPTF